MRFRRINLYDLCIYGFIILPVVSLSQHSTSFRDVIPIFVLALFSFIVGNKTLKIRGYHKIIYLLYLSMLLSNLINTPVTVNLLRTQATFLLFIFLFHFLTSIEIDKKKMDKIIYLQIITGFISSLIICLSAIFNKPYGWNRYSLNFIGLNKNPNYVGAYIVLSFFFLLLYKFDINFKILKLKFYYLILFIMVLGLSLTGTRAVFLNLALVIIINIVRLLNKKKISFFRIIIYLVTILVGSVLLITFIPENIVKRVISFENYTSDSRITAWLIVYYYFIESPFLGLGYYGSNNILQAYSGSLDYLHNVFLEILFDQGIIGLLLLLMSVIAILMRYKPSDKLLGYGLAIILFMPITFQNGIVSMTLWFPMTILALVSEISRKSRSTLIN